VYPRAECTIGPVPRKPYQEFAAFIKAETAKWAKVVKDAGIPRRDL